MKAGDWVLSEHKVKQIKEIDGDWLTVSDGYFETSGRMKVFSLTLKGKRWAEYYEDRYNDLHRLDPSGKLNWPAISNHINALWEGQMENLDNANYAKSVEFFAKIEDELNKLNTVIVDGIKVFR